MVLNEEKAKSKWCPMTAPLMASLQQPMVEDCSRCIASACMMWDEMVSISGEVVGYCGLCK
jgi:hypothetical protein